MPKQVDHEERRQQLTAALLRIASTRGLQAVSMREVAAEAGVSLRAVQYYFTDKLTLLNSGLSKLAARFDRRAKGRAAAAGGDLTAHQVLEVLAMANGLTSSILGEQRTHESAAAILDYQLDRLFPTTIEARPSSG